MDTEVVARYVETRVAISKARGKARSYNEKQLQVGEFNEVRVCRERKKAKAKEKEKERA